MNEAKASSQSPCNAKHTPGPWRSAEIFRDNAPNIIGIMGPRSATSGFNGFCVAHVEKEVDARLIAAAPELLDMLKRVYQHFMLLRADDRPMILSRDVEEVVAKAEGAHHV